MTRGLFMTPTRNSDTIVIQSFRKNIIPTWIQRCLDSVQKWSKSKGHDYSLAGDEFYDLCGPEYLKRGSKNPQAITNLARLVATRQRLDAGYQRVIWMDADVFVFDPAKLVLDFSAESLTTGYAFGREVWLSRDLTGVNHVTAPRAHNAATFFTQHAVDLDMLITLIRHIDARRQIISNFQVGVDLLRGLQYSLMFPTFSHVAVFSPVLLRALTEHDEKVLQLYGRAYRYQSCAGNLGLSQQHDVTEDVLRRAMDHLEASAGDAINRYAADTGALVPYNCETSIGEQSATFNMWSYRAKVILRRVKATFNRQTLNLPLI
jgi:hypothetical protein